MNVGGRFANVEKLTDAQLLSLFMRDCMEIKAMEYELDRYSDITAPKFEIEKQMCATEILNRMSKWKVNGNDKRSK